MLSMRLKPSCLGLLRPPTGLRVKSRTYFSGANYPPLAINVLTHILWGGGALLCQKPLTYLPLVFFFSYSFFFSSHIRAGIQFWELHYRQINILPLLKRSLRDNIAASQRQYFAASQRQHISLFLQIYWMHRNYIILATSTKQGACTWIPALVTYTTVVLGGYVLA